MDKTAAEKIAHEYYNAGIEVALQQAGLVKEANRTKALSAILGGTALAPAALSHMGHGGAYGEALLNALKSVNPTHSFDPSKLKAIGSGLADDAGQLKQFLMGLGG